jgi:hypothetical protein
MSVIFFAGCQLWVSKLHIVYNVLKEQSVKSTLVIAVSAIVALTVVVIGKNPWAESPDRPPYPEKVFMHFQSAPGIVAEEPRYPNENSISGLAFVRASFKGKDPKDATYCPVIVLKSDDLKKGDAVQVEAFDSRMIIGVMDVVIARPAKKK